MQLALFLLPASGLALGAFSFWGRRWGSTPEERSLQLPGDSLFGDSSDPRLCMSRAISINAPPDRVFRWMAQMGRGGGWYSYDWIDNAGKSSAGHLIRWLPAPEIGDSCAIGRLQYLESGRSLTWWAHGLAIPGGRFRCAFDIHALPDADRTRLLIRISADASGPLARPLLFAFSIGDSVMARKQLLSVRSRVERYGDREENPDHPESGARDQYQLLACKLAKGERAGRLWPGLAERWVEADEL